MASVGAGLAAAERALGVEKGRAETLRGDAGEAKQVRTFDLPLFLITSPHIAARGREEPCRNAAGGGRRGEASEHPSPKPWALCMFIYVVYFPNALAVEKGRAETLRGKVGEAKQVSISHMVFFFITLEPRVE